MWTGVAVLGTAILGMMLVGKEASAARLACIGLMVGGIKLLLPR